MGADDTPAAAMQYATIGGGEEPAEGDGERPRRLDEAVGAGVGETERDGRGVGRSDGVRRGVCAEQWRYGGQWRSSGRRRAPKGDG
jgi:hypothetical protein